MKAYSTLSLTHFPYLTTLLTPYMTPENFLWPRDAIYPSVGWLHRPTMKWPKWPSKWPCYYYYETSGLRPASASVCFRRIWGCWKLFDQWKILLATLCLQLKFKRQTQSMILITSTSVSSLMSFYSIFHSLCWCLSHCLINNNATQNQNCNTFVT